MAGDIEPDLARSAPLAALQNADWFVQRMRILANGVGLT
jgi:hypothetical protein